MFEVNQNSQIGTNKKEKKKVKTLSAKLYSISKDVAALILWFLLLNSLFFHSIRIYEFLHSLSLSPYYLAIRPYRFLMLICLIILSSIFFGGTNTFKYIALYVIHFIFFPIIIFFRFLRFIFIYSPKTFKIGGKTAQNMYSKVTNTVQKTSTQIFCFVIAFICFYIIGTSFDVISISISIVVLLGILFLHLSYLLLWTTNPFLILNNFNTIIEKIWTFIKKWRIDEQYINKKDKIKDMQKEKKDLKDFVKYSAKTFNWLKDKMDKLTHRRLLLRWFIIIFIVALGFTVVIFSFEYYGLTKINTDSFSILKTGQYFEHLYYSISILSTIDSGGVIPLTRIAKLFVIFQVLSGIFLLTILVTSFSTMTLEVASEDREKLLSRIDDKLSWLETFTRAELNTDFQILLLKENDVKRLTGREVRK